MRVEGDDKCQSIDYTSPDICLKAILITQVASCILSNIPMEKLELIKLIIWQARQKVYCSFFMFIFSIKILLKSAR